MIINAGYHCQLNNSIKIEINNIMSDTEQSFDKSTQEVKKTLTEPKSYGEILEEQIESGLKEHQRSNASLFISGISAGLEVCFSVFLMGIIYTMFF